MLTQEQREKIKYLNQYRYLNADIDRKIHVMDDWRKKIYSVTGTLSDMPKSGNREDTISTGIAVINEIEESINTDIDELLKTQRDIEKCLNDISDLNLQQIMKCRYLDGKTWEQIAYESNYSWRQVYNLHEKALNTITLH